MDISVKWARLYNALFLLSAQRKNIREAQAFSLSLAAVFHSIDTVFNFHVSRQQLKRQYSPPAKRCFQ